MTAPFICSQDEPKPQVPEDAFSTRELIAWSSMQKPQPTPQPLPPPDKPIPAPDSQSQSAPRQEAPDTQPATSDANTFIGRIAKQGSGYVLTVSGGTTYKLSSDTDLGRFESKNVKVTGKLESDANTIHVSRIELLS